jgi:hypothetical protein
MRFAVLQSVICAAVPAVSGSTDPAMTSPFPTDLCGVSATPAPVLVKVRVHPLRNLASSTENSSVFIGPPPEGDEHTNAGFAPLRDTSTRSPLTAKLQHSAYCSTHSVSHALDGLLLQSATWVCFAPQPRAGFTLQGFPLPLGRLRLIAGSFPHVVQPTRLPEASSRCQLADRRLQGVYLAAIRCPE